MHKHRIALDVANMRFMENYRINVIRGVVKYVHRHTSWQLLTNERDFSLNHFFRDPRDLQRLGADGIILSSCDEERLRQIEPLGIPMVSFSNDAEGENLPLARVISDDIEVGRLAAHHFLERGFRHFAFYGDQGMLWERDRLTGYREVLRAEGLACEVGPGGPRGRGWATDRRLRQWLEGLPRPVAVMASTDTRALHVLETCQSLGLSVPRELALLGVDNNPLVCEGAIPSISSVEQNAARVGYTAAALLDRSLSEGRQRCDVIAVPPRGVVSRLSSDVLAVEDDAIAIALQFVRDHATDPVHVSDVVRASGVSRSTLERRFRDQLGVTVNDTLRRRRLERAKSLLLDSPMSLSRIAEACGFHRATYLCHVFQEELGTTPGKWRSQRQWARESDGVTRG